MTQRTTSRFSLVALFAALLLVLSACGARVTTALELNDAGAGTRTMSFKMERNQDAEGKIQGGFDAVDAAIKKHLPAELTYSGLNVADADVTGSFTLTFSSLDDYKDKVAKVLEAGGKAITPKVTFYNADGMLKKGFKFTENFSSTHLLKWLPEALVVENVIDKSEASNVIEAEGAGTVKFGDKTYTQEYGGTLRIDETQDQGFSSVALEIAPVGEKGYDVVVRTKRSGTPGAPLKKLDDDFFASLKIAGAKVDADVDSESRNYQRTLSFSAASEKELVERVDAVFGKDTTKFEVANNSGKDARIERTYKGSVDPVQICADYCDVSVKVSAPEGYKTPTNDDEDTNYGTGAFEFTFVKSVSFDSMNITMDVDMSRQWTLNIDAVLDMAEYEAFLDQIDETLTPPAEAGTMTKSDADGKRTYSLVLKPAADNSRAVNEFVRGTVEVGDVSAIEREAYGADYQVNLKLDPASMVGMMAVDKVSARVNLGTFHTFSDATGGWTVDGSTASYEGDGGELPALYAYASGPSLGKIIGLSILGVLVLVGVALAVIFRKRLAPILSRAGKSAKAASVSAVDMAKEASHSAATGYSTAMAQAGAAGVADSPQGFTEHNLR